MGHVCGECKLAFGRSCCELPKGTNPSMPLSLPEVSRIAKHTGKSTDEFVVMQDIDEDEFNSLATLGDAYRKSLTGHTLIRLATTDTDEPDTVACVFLKKGEGCTLPKEVRPHGCRLFPFVYNSRFAKSEGGGVVSIPPPAPCLAHIAAAGDEAKLASLLETSHAQLTLIGRQRELDAETHEELLK